MTSHVDRSYSTCVWPVLLIHCEPSLHKGVGRNLEHADNEFEFRARCSLLLGLCRSLHGEIESNGDIEDYHITY